MSSPVPPSLSSFFIFPHFFAFSSPFPCFPWIFILIIYFFPRRRSITNALSKVTLQPLRQQQETRRQNQQPQPYGTVETPPKAGVIVALTSTDEWLFLLECRAHLL